MAVLLNNPQLRYNNSLQFGTATARETTNAFQVPSHRHQQELSASNFAQEFLSEYYSRVSSCLPAAVAMYAKEASRTHFEPSGIFNTAVNRTSVGHVEIHEALVLSPIVRGAWRVGSLQVCTPPADESGCSTRGILSISVVISNDSGYRRAQSFAVAAPRPGAFLSSFAYWDNVILSEVIQPVAALRHQTTDDTQSGWGYPAYPHTLSPLHHHEAAQRTFTANSDDDVFLPPLHPIVLSDFTKPPTGGSTTPGWISSAPTTAKSMPCTPRNTSKPPKVSDSLTDSSRVTCVGSGECLSADAGSTFFATPSATDHSGGIFSPKRDAASTAGTGVVEGEDEGSCEVGSLPFDGNTPSSVEDGGATPVSAGEGETKEGAFCAGDSTTADILTDDNGEAANGLLSFVFSGDNNYMATAADDESMNDVSKRLASLLDSLSSVATTCSAAVSSQQHVKMDHPEGADEMPPHVDDMDNLDNNYSSGSDGVLLPAVAKDEAADIGNLLHVIQTEAAAACEDLPGDTLSLPYYMDGDKIDDQCKVDQTMFDVLCTLLRQNDKKEEPNIVSSSDTAAQVASLLATPSGEPGGADYGVDMSPFKANFVFDEFDSSCQLLPSVEFSALPYKSRTAPATPRRSSPVTPVSLTPSLCSKTWLANDGDDDGGYGTPQGGLTPFDTSFTLTAASSSVHGLQHGAPGFCSTMGEYGRVGNSTVCGSNVLTRGRSVFSSNFDRTQRHDLHTSTSHPRLSSEQLSYEEIINSSCGGKTANIYTNADDQPTASPRSAYHTRHRAFETLQHMDSGEYLNSQSLTQSPTMMTDDLSPFRLHHDDPSKNTRRAALPNGHHSSSRHPSPSPSTCSAPATQSAHFNVNRNKTPAAAAPPTTGPTFWGMWEDERDRMVYVSWLPRVARATDRTDKKKCELQLKEFIGSTLGFKHLEKVLLFPPSSAHCKLIFKAEVWAQLFLDVYGGLEGTAGPESWKQIVCNEFDVNIKEGIESTRVKVIWADQTKNERTVLGIRACDPALGGSALYDTPVGSEEANNRSTDAAVYRAAGRNTWNEGQGRQVMSHSTTTTPLMTPRSGNAPQTKKKSAKLTSSKSQPNWDMQSLIESSGHGMAPYHNKHGGRLDGDGVQYHQRYHQQQGGDDVAPPPPSRSSRHNTPHVNNQIRGGEGSQRVDFASSQPPPSSSAMCAPPMAPWARFPSTTAVSAIGNNLTHDIYRTPGTQPIYATYQTPPPGYGLPHPAPAMYYFPAHPATMLSRGAAPVSMPMFHHSGYNM